MFDADKKMTLEGTIKEFSGRTRTADLMKRSETRWPQEQWAIELAAPGGLARQGWVPKTLTPGMKVTAVIHALRTARMAAVHGSHASGRDHQGNPNGASRTPTRARLVDLVVGRDPRFAGALK